MTLIEVPKQTLTDELEKLDQAEKDRLFVIGARAALLWVRDGGIPPSALWDLLQ